MPARTIAWCALILIAALIVVGIVSDGVLRHIVQTAPAWIIVALGASNSNLTKWAAPPVFVVWLIILTLIWLYLLGMARVITGHFSPTEIAMTIIVGISSVWGLVNCFRLKNGTGFSGAMLVLLIMTAAQVGAIVLSTQPAIADDEPILNWLATR